VIAVYIAKSTGKWLITPRPKEFLTKNERRMAKRKVRTGSTVLDIEELEDDRFKERLSQSV